jgi:hypothetical protein
MLRIADLYERRDILPPGSGAGQNNIATRMLAELLDCRPGSRRRPSRLRANSVLARTTEAVARFGDVQIE